MKRGGFHVLTIADVRHETDDAVSLAFAVPPGLRRTFAFAPGQYLTLRIVLAGEEIRRSYSICSGLDDGELRIAVKQVAGGAFSRFARESLKPGDTLEAMPPMGHFTVPLQPDGARNLLAIAAGSGITPVLSILKSVLAREPHSRFTLLYGNRTSRHILFAETLAALKDRYLGRLSLAHVLSREAQDIPVLQGRLDRGRIARLLAAAAPGAARPGSRFDHAFLCGPAALMDEAALALADLGLLPAQIHVEHFTPGTGGRSATADAQAEPLRNSGGGPEADSEPGATVDIVLDGRRRRVEVPAGVSIIDAARDAGLDLPYACRGGMCCTCRARLVEGTADMAVNYSLQPEEIAAGFILACQARPQTPHLVLDFDQV